MNTNTVKTITFDLRDGCIFDNPEFMATFNERDMIARDFRKGKRPCPSWSASFVRNELEHYEAVGITHLQVITAYYDDSVPVSTVWLVTDANNPTFCGLELDLWWFFGSQTYPGLQLLCLPSLLVSLLPFFPATHDNYLFTPSFYPYVYTVERVSEAINLTPHTSFSDYLQSLPTKDFKTLRDNLKKNSDCAVTILRPSELCEAQRNEIAGLVTKYADFWKARDTHYGNFIPYLVTSTFDAFSESSVVMLIYKSDVLVAVNLAHIVNNTTVVDMVCLRDPTEADTRKRGLGIFAILKNIEYAIQQGYKTYWFTDGSQSYKQQFGLDVPFRVLRTASAIDLCLARQNLPYYLKGELIDSQQALEAARRNVTLDDYETALENWPEGAIVEKHLIFS